MAQLVIVTPYTYLICESINSIVVDCHDSDIDFMNALENELMVQRKKKPARKLRYTAEEARERARYNITINYTPSINATSGHHEQRECQVTVHGYSQALKAFTQIVEQIREQIPDQLYLNKLVENMLNGGNND